MPLQQRDGGPSAPWEPVTRGESRRLRGAWSLSRQAPHYLPTGKQLKYQQKGCAPSCDEVSRVMQQLSQMSPMDVLDPADLQGQPKFESQGLVCCEKDLCNGGTGHLGPGGGLLLSLGPILLWALL